ncbi:MAG: ABC transporter permease [bacterium]|nr:ABC transporter permease [bacterium]
MKLSDKQLFWLEFVWAMTIKEIKARYKHAILGFLWIILNPLLQMLVIGFVFQFFLPVHVDNYFLFLFSGLLPWIFFSFTLSKCTPAIVYERSLIKKARFPREAIILSIVFSNVFHLLVSLALFFVVLLFVGKVSLLQLALLPIAVVWITLLASGFSLLATALNARFRDVNFFVQAVVPLWFYATPIVYTLDLIPQNLHALFYLNPMTAVIEAFRFALLGMPVTQASLWLVSVAASLLLCVLGWVVFQRESRYFDDWV